MLTSTIVTATQTLTLTCPIELYMTDIPKPKAVYASGTPIFYSSSSQFDEQDFLNMKMLASVIDTTINDIAVQQKEFQKVKDFTSAKELSTMMKGYQSLRKALKIIEEEVGYIERSPRPVVNEGPQWKGYIHENLREHCKFLDTLLETMRYPYDDKIYDRETVTNIVGGYLVGSTGYLDKQLEEIKKLSDFDKSNG